VTTTAKPRKELSNQLTRQISSQGLLDDSIPESNFVITILGTI
jgi:hypothetical protein